MEDLSGRVAMITGATGGLGHAVTIALARCGADCVVLYRSQSQMAELTATLDQAGVSVSSMQLDVLNADAFADAVTQTISQHARIDIMVHLVGGYLGGPRIENTSPEQWRTMFDLNVHSAYNCSHAILPHMRERGYGRIVAVGSRSAVHVDSGVAAYASAKAALLALVEAIAAENHSIDVTANAVLPSIIDTAANRNAMPNANHETWPKPGQIADVIAFLASERSALISGAAIPVYGHA